MKNIGKVIRGARVRRGIGQIALAAKVDVNVGYLSQIEIGDRAYKSMDTLIKFAKELGLPFTAFIFLCELDELERSNPELVKAIFEACPDLRRDAFFIRMQQDGLIRPLPTRRSQQ